MAGMLDSRGETAASDVIIALVRWPLVIARM